MNPGAPAAGPPPTYRHTQSGRPIVVGIAFGGLLLVGGAFLASQSGAPPAVVWMSVLSIPFLALASFAFASLTVTVNPAQVNVAFGPGWVRHTIPLSSLVGATAVRNNRERGGIRWTPAGWQWGVSGRDAVELAYRDGRRFRIGTDQPQELAAAINAQRESAAG